MKIMSYHCVIFSGGIKNHKKNNKKKNAGYINLNIDHFCLNKRIKLRKWTFVYNCMLINLSSFDTKI